MGHWDVLYVLRTNVSATEPTTASFDQLAPTFSRDDLRALKSGTTESGLRNIVMRWKRDGWIVPVDRHHWQKRPSVPSSQRPIKQLLNTQRLWNYY